MVFLDPMSQVRRRMAGWAGRAGLTNGKRNSLFSKEHLRHAEFNFVAASDALEHYDLSDLNHNHVDLFGNADLGSSNFSLLALRAGSNVNYVDEVIGLRKRTFRR